MYCCPSNSIDFCSSFCHEQKPPESAETFVVVVSTKDSFKAFEPSQSKRVRILHATSNQEGRCFLHSNHQTTWIFWYSTVEPTFGMAFNCMEKSDMLSAV